MQMTMRIFIFVLGLCASLWLVGCGQSAGAPCAFKGDGFQSRHNCATQCLARWDVRCPDGSDLRPAVCAGRKGCTPGSCPDGQVCYSFDDPFEEVSYCIPDNVCGAATSIDLLRRWEQDSADKAAASRAAMAAKRQHRSGAVTVPVPVSPKAE
jgi:hypothetical protein